MNSTTLQAEAHDARPLILLVDDDALMLDLLATLVEAAGYAVCVASSGARALAMLAAAERLPDLALLDIAMPGMSGLELAAQLNGGPTMPFMFLSADGDAAVVARATAVGAVGYLVKPFNAAQIAPVIAAALAQAGQMSALRQSENRLANELSALRDTDIAVGMLIERYQTDRDTALRVMRDHARAQQRKLADIAAELVGASALLSSLGARLKAIARK